MRYSNVVSSTAAPLTATVCARVSSTTGPQLSCGLAQPPNCGPVVLDTRAQTVAVSGAAVELTTFEYRILEHLMLRAGDVISKTELTERLYDQDFERDSNVIEVLVGRLRRKLDPQDELRPIETLRGRGYRFALPRDAAS